MMSGLATCNGFILSKGVSVQGRRASSGPNYLLQTTYTNRLISVVYDYNILAKPHLGHLR